MSRFGAVSFLIAVFCIVVIVGQSSNQHRCLQFTWLGPRWTNESKFENVTCDAVTSLARGVPCFQPLVVSEDGTWPDIPYIWHNHQDAASCSLTDGDVCASFIYYFDGHQQNATFMCTRAIDTRGLAISSGCYTQTNGSFSQRACFCRPRAGAEGIPCNNAVSTFVGVSFTFVILIHTIIKKLL